jgi:phosphotransferase system enzyme I (PtsP)
MSGTRRLLTRLRAMMAGADEGTKDGSVLRQLTKLVAGELVAEVCTIYAKRPGDLLELTATYGLNQDAVGRTRLRVGEGIVGLVAATGKLQNLPDAQNHPAFAYRPETGEEPYASLLAVPVRRAGRTLGVVAVQNRAPRLYAEDECEVLETVAMLLAELLPTSGATDGAEQGLASTLPRRFAANPIAPGIAIGPVALHGMGSPLRRLLAEDPAAETRRLTAAAATMRQSLEELIETGMPDGDGPRAVLEATRLVAADGGWMRRVREAIETGLTAEAAVHRVTNEVRDRMRRIADPYLRERLADLEDLAGRLLAALDGGDGIDVPRGAILLARRLGPAQLLEWHARGIAGVVIEEGSTAGHAAILARALGLPAIGGARGALEAVEEGDDAVLDADEGQLILRPDQEVRSAYNRALQVRLVTEQGFAAQRLLPAQTRDGVALQLMLNVGLALEMEQLDATGAACSAPRSPCSRAVRSLTFQTRRRFIPGCWTLPGNARCGSARWTSAVTSYCRTPNSRRRRTRRWAGAAFASASTARRYCAVSSVPCCLLPPGARSASCSRWSPTLPNSARPNPCCWPKLPRSGPVPRSASAA